MTTAVQVCENTLQAIKAENIKLGIVSTENAVIDRLLARRNELLTAYGEVHAKLHSQPDAIWVLFDALLGAAIYWNPEKVAESRKARETLKELNKSIAVKATELAELIEKRRALGNTSGFSSDTEDHIVDLIDQASKENGHYRSFLETPLKALQGRFDWKYWPKLDALLWVISSDAAQAGISATDSITEAAAAGSRGSKADTFKAIFSGFDLNSAENGGLLPRGFHLTDETLASFANCLLDLSPDEMVDGGYVKTRRARFEKERLARNDSTAP